MNFAGFDWDRGNRGKCEKHGVSAAEIEEIFTRTVLVSPDPAHSAAEERFKAIGLTANGRRLFVVFTWRTRGEELLLRPISARFMHAKEIAAYEEIASDKKELPGSQ